MRRADNVAEFKALEAAIVASEADLEAKKWRQAELAAEAVAGGMSQREYGAAVGKVQSTISRYVNAWRRWGGDPALDRPSFSDAVVTVDTGVADGVVTGSDIARRRRERQVPTRHEDKVEMAETILADQAVVDDVLARPTMASRTLDNAVAERRAERRERRRDNAERIADAEAMPLSAYMSRMVVQIDDWAGTLRFIRDELEALPEGRGRELVAVSLRGLIEAAQHDLDALEPKRASLDVIEGAAR